MVTNVKVPIERGESLDEPLRRRLVRALEAHGSPSVLATIGLSSAAIWRAAAGGRIHKGTALAIEHGLAALEDEEA